MSDFCLHMCPPKPFLTARKLSHYWDIARLQECSHRYAMPVVFIQKLGLEFPAPYEGYNRLYALKGFLLQCRLFNEDLVEARDP